MEIKIKFDSPEAANNFIAWWIDGGGEQYLSYNTTCTDLINGYLRVEGNGENEMD